MGKNLKGKECGKGICQRKDGLYYARFVDKTGKRHEKYLPTLPEARNWIEESKYADAHEDVFVATDTTVDQWFDFWIENIVGDLAPNTLRNYRERYVHNIQPVMGKMMIANVKPMHCKKVFIQMDADYAGSTIRQAYITMGTMFKAAKMNDLIAKHPMDGVRFTKPVRATDVQAFLLGLSCVILFLSTGEQESQRRTVPMIPTYISSATKRGSSTFVCTPCDIPTLQERLKAVCSRRCYKSCWVMPASKQQWIGMFM